MKKRIIMKFKGGFRDGQALDSENLDQKDELDNVLFLVDGGIVGRSCASANTFLKPFIQKNAQHRYSVVKRIEDGDTIHLTMEYSVADKPYGQK